MFSSTKDPWNKYYFLLNWPKNLHIEKRQTHSFVKKVLKKSDALLLNNSHMESRVDKHHSTIICTSCRCFWTVLSCRHPSQRAKPPLISTASWEVRFLSYVRMDERFLDGGRGRTAYQAHPSLCIPQHRR